MATSEKGLNNPHTIYFDSREHFNKVLTQQKIQVLSLIAKYRPRSISELSDLIPELNREQMLKICNELEAESFIKLIKTPKREKVPTLAFEYDAIYIEDPNDPLKAENLFFISPVSLIKLQKASIK